MKRFLLFLLYFFPLISCFSQNRNNNWYFGTFEGLSFNTNPPTPLPANLEAKEGCASISDNNGNLLFYTEGRAVWNRNHVIMPNGTGLKGEGSATQAVLIIPKPCDSNIYYIFTVPEVETGHDTLYYSILDMTLNSGLGDITIKNIPLRGRIKEKLLGVIKSNGIDFWVMVKETDSNAFLAFTVNSNGVDPVPVISNAGPIVTTAIWDAGYMQVSPDNSKLAVAYSQYHICLLLDFDNSTGMVSNPISLPVERAYGVEFSPDNSKLYVSATSTQQIHQFNLSAGSPVDIQNSVVLIPTLTYYPSALMLGPDNKIYIAALSRPFLSAITEPNQPGLACNYTYSYIYLPTQPGYLNLCYHGLPNNLKHFSSCLPCQPVTNISNNAAVCANQTYQLPSGATVSASGTYPDTIRNLANTCDSILYTIHLTVYEVSLLNTEAHICSSQTYQLPSGTIVSTAGVYIDTLRNQTSCDSVVNTIHLFVDQVSFADENVHVCPGQTYQLPAGMIVSVEGIYIDTLRSQALCDSLVTSTHLFVDHASFVNADVHICPGQTYQLPSGAIVNAAAVYSDTLRSVAGCDSVVYTIRLLIDQVVLVNTAAHICSNQTYQLPSGITVSAEGTYIDTLRSQASCDSIINTIQLTLNDVSFSSQADSIYPGQTYTLPSGTVVSAAGTYQSVLINSLGCDSVITTVLKLKRTIAECLTLKNAFTPNADGINDNWVLYRYHCFKKLELNVYNRYGSLVYHSDDYKNDWYGLYKNKPVPDGTYYYITRINLFDGGVHTIKGNVTILR